MSLEEVKEKAAELAGLTLSNKAKNLCVKCSQPFSNANVHTAAGWYETEISGLCESCWDDLFRGY